MVRKLRTATLLTFIYKLSGQLIDVDNLSGQLTGGEGEYRAAVLGLRSMVICRVSLLPIKILNNILASLNEQLNSKIPQIFQ